MAFETTWRSKATPSRSRLTAPAGLTQARTLRPDLVILDLMLPGLDGYRVLKALREDGLDMPVLILTAHGQEADKVRGFRLGADDYVTKPFGLLELVARVAALLRRTAQPRTDVTARPRERFGEIEIDPSTRSVYRGREAVALTPMEFDLLVALVRRRGAVVSRLDLLHEVWGHSSARPDPHGGHAHRGAASKAGSESRDAQAHPDGAQGGIPAGTVLGVRSCFLHD